MAIQIDVVVVVIDRVDESDTFIHFVGMLVGSCFKALKGWRVQNSVPEANFLGTGTLEN